MNNIDVVRRALAHFDQRLEEQRLGVAEYTPLDYGPWFSSLADDVVVDIPCTVATPASELVVGRVHRGKKAVIDMFKMSASDRIVNWELERPLEYFASKDRVVVLGAERYTLSDTGTSAPYADFAMVFDCRDGMIVHYKHIIDYSFRAPLWWGDSDLPVGTPSTK